MTPVRTLARMMDTNEVAAAAGCSASNIRRLRLAGRMPAATEMKGQSWVWSAAAIEEWLGNRPRQGERPWRPA